MNLRRITTKTAALLAGLTLALSLTGIAAQKVTAVKLKTADANTDESQVVQTQQTLLTLLRQTPTVAGVLVRDSSLLADQSYIMRSNPPLAQFLAAHPEVARNPDYYLFTGLPHANGSREHALQRELWPEYMHDDSPVHSTHYVDENLIPIIVIPAIFGTIFWIIRLMIASRFQSRSMKQQGELQGRLIDKLGSSQDLVAYLSTEAGQRLLASNSETLGAAPVTAQTPYTVARILWPLQIGVVLILLSICVNCLRGSNPRMDVQLISIGILLFWSGLGFILCAAIAWVMGRRLGILAPKPKSQTEPLDRP
jgi:hypothetical protein